MMCATCGHAHIETQTPVSYIMANDKYGYRMEPTHHICRECPCATLDPTDYDDRIALIQAGEIDA